MTRQSIDIIEAASRAFQVPVQVIKSDIRSAPACAPRFAAMKLMREERCLSYPVIGRLLDRDHSTVMSGIRRANELLATDPDFAAAYERARQG